jgi:uncharacterized protein (DUF58 family)
MLLAGTGLVFVLFAAGTFVFGSPFAAISWLSGGRLRIEPARVDLGLCRGGERRDVQFTIHNAGVAPVTIVGGTTTCNCVTTEGLPVTIPAGGSREVHARVYVVGTGPKFQQAITFYGDGHYLQAVQAHVTAQVELKPEAETAR